MARARTLALRVQADIHGVDQIASIGKKLSTVGRDLTRQYTLPILAAGAAAFKFASDVDEASGRASKVFERNAERIQRASESMDDSFSQATFLDEASGFGAILQQIGFVEDAAADLSLSWLDLAQDMASFHDTKPDEAIGAIRSALAGEFEPLKRYGVFLNETIVRQKAMEQGLFDGVGAIDAQTRALIVNQEIFAQQPKVLGDFERTSQNAANATRILIANFTDAAAVLGTELLPAGTELLKTVNGWVRGFRDMDPEVRTWIVRLAAIVAATGPVLFVFGKLLTSIKLFVSGGRLAVAAWRNIPTAIGFVDLALAKMAGGLTTVTTALGVSRLALLGWIGVVGAAGFAVAEGYNNVLDDLTGRILRDFATQHGLAADKVTADVARIADALGVDIPEAQKRLLAAMNGNADLYDESVRSLVKSTEIAKRDISAALVESEKDWETYNTVISDAMFGEGGAVPTIGAGVDGMAAEMFKAPGEMADALLAAQFELTGPDGAIAELVNFMDQALSPVQERFNIQGFLASKELATALTSNNPLIRTKAEEMQQAAIARLAEIRSAFWSSGSSAAYSFGQGLTDPATVTFVSNSAARLAAAARGIFPDSEPKDPNSPFRGITKGFGFGEILGKGILTGKTAFAGAVRGLVGDGLSMPGVGSLSPAAGGGGGVVNYNTFNLHWDGEPPQGRTEAEIAGTLKRLSAMWGY